MGFGILAENVDYTKQVKRRALLEAGVEFSLAAALAELTESREFAAEDGVFIRPPPVVGNYFSDAQRNVLDAVLMQLFPADGNGPSASDLNARPYLEWAITDPVNANDGDPKFIGKGIERLTDMSQQAYGAGFVELTHELQNEVLERIAQSKFGKNWLSLLLFYLTEALMLDPYYGGNPDMIGWLWLDHRPGFPRPVAGKTYRDFD